MSGGLARAALALCVASVMPGCAVVTATATTASEVAAAGVKAAGKVTVATVKTSGKVISSAVTSSGDVTALTLESAAKLARVGMVVAVDSSGVVTELPWQQGLKLGALVEGSRYRAAAELVNVFRRGRKLELDWKRAREVAEEFGLESGDVVEFRRRS